LSLIIFCPRFDNIQLDFLFPIPNNLEPLNPES
jgi:hypothetical protein